MAVAEEVSGAVTMIDETYEFSAPRFFDFTKAESEEDASRAEIWFETALSYAPSPFMPKIKTGRSITVESLCDFSEADKMQKTAAPSNIKADDHNLDVNIQPQCMSAKINKDPPSSEAEEDNNIVAFDLVSANMERSSGNDHEGEGACLSDNIQRQCSVAKLKKDAHCSEGKQVSGDMEKSHRREEESACLNSGGESLELVKEAYTPNPSIASQKKFTTTISNRQQTAKKIAALVKNPSAMKAKALLQSSAVKTKAQLQSSAIKTKAQLLSSAMKSSAGTPHLSQENQAVKRQKLEGGGARQILNVKPQNLPHKSKLSSATSNASTSNANRAHKEDRKVYVREVPTPASVPFVSMAEMMRKFQSSTRDLSLPCVNSNHSHGNVGSMIKTKPKLKLTRPKEPEFETAQRARSVKVKSTAELEEEMMAKMPKFKARPLNKKILQAPTLPPVPRSAPQPPEFKEFHLETTARAQNADSASVASEKLSHQEPWKPHLTEPKTPLLQTSLRARPPKVKSSLELEQEELENIPKFKARPLNKKIFESKGDIGIFCHAKKHVTQPQEFHFATDERIPPPSAVADLFDKLSLNSEPAHKNPVPRNTTPNPFLLYTEERGAEKEKKLLVELVQKHMEEERARIPKANPYPYTTDYPVIPPKPEPKHCTKAEPFQLESLVRHEEEMEREMEERRRKEREEAQMRNFKAQPILKEDPIPVPEKVRKPLTQVQEFNLHVNDRAMERAEFDQKIKEKEMMYKRYREESEAAKMIEEEKALKQLRRTMIPHARPVPNFDHPFYPQKSAKETTKAKSPHLRVIYRKERRKIFNGAGASSPASSIR